MATGGSEAQMSLCNIKCDLCHNYVDVEWKCINCDEILCTNCKQLHLKIKALRDHIIVDHKTADQQQMYSKLFCSEHPKEEFQMYCLTCNFPICLVCITEKHRPHKFEKLDKFVDRKRQELDANIDMLKRTRLVSLTSALNRLTQNQTSYSQKLDKLVNEIKERAEELKQQINEIRDKLIHELRNKGIQDQQQMKHTQDQIEAQMKSLRELIKESEEKMKITTNTDVILTVDNIRSSLAKLNPSPEIHLLSPPTFVIGSIQQSKMEEFFGHISDRARQNSTGGNQDSSMPQPQPKVNIVSSFRQSEAVDWIAPSGVNQHIWLGKKETSLLHLYSYTGVLVKSINVGSQIRDIAVTSTGEILATTKNGKVVKKITKMCKIEKFADTSPYITRKITMTKDGDTLVSLCDNKKGRVIRLSATGQTKQIIEFKDDKSLLSHPYSMTENTNGDVWIISSKISGRCIVVVSKDGKYKFTYRGPQVQLKAMFWFSGITHNNNGQILVSDIGNGTVHLIDKDGLFLYYIITKEDGVQLLKSLSIDEVGQLLVGCQDGRVAIVRYLQ